MSQQEAESVIHNETGIRNKKLQAVGTSAVALALKHGPDRVRRSVEDIAVRRIITSKGFETRFVAEPKDVQKALDLEREVWRQEDYGDLEDYKKYIPQSRIFAAFDGSKCVGMNRIFAGSPLPPPFIAEMPIDDPKLKQKLIDGGKNLKVEEYGTVAVDKGQRGGRVFLDLCRQAYRDATERGIETWGIIMEPERVQQMNRLLGFTFEQIGPAVDYQGGECAAHIMDFNEVRENMSATRPALYDWFVNQPL